MGETKRTVSVKISEETYVRILRLHDSLPHPKCSFSALCGHLIEQDLDLIAAGIVNVAEPTVQDLLRKPRNGQVVEFVHPIEIIIQEDLRRQLEANRRLLRSGEASVDESEKRRA